MRKTALPGGSRLVPANAFPEREQAIMPGGDKKKAVPQGHYGTALWDFPFVRFKAQPIR